MSFYMIERYNYIGLCYGRAYLGSLAIFTVYGNLYVVKSFQTIGNYYLCAYAEGGISVSDSGVLMVNGI